MCIIFPVALFVSFDIDCRQLQPSVIINANSHNYLHNFPQGPCGVPMWQVQISGTNLQHVAYVIVIS